MSKSVVYVGVDVGKSELVVAVVGRRPHTFHHSGAGVRGMMCWLRGTVGEDVVQVCMEATGIYSRRLALCLLRQPEVKVSIINPAQIKAFRQVLLRRTKTDGVDAEVILAYAQSQKPVLWEPGSKVMEELAALVKEADRLRSRSPRWSRPSSSFVKRISALWNRWGCCGQFQGWGPSRPRSF